MSYFAFMWSCLLTLILICLCLLAFWQRKAIKSWWRSVILVFQLDGPPSSPLLGNIFMFKNNKELFRIAETMYEKYAPICRGWLSILPIVIVLDPNYLRIILNSSKLSEKNFLYSLMHIFLGEGLITSNGQKWKSHRNYISLYFKTNYLEQFIQTFDECADIMVEQLQGKHEVKMTHFINRCVLNILHKAILGIPLKAREVLDRSPFDKGDTSIVLQRMFQPWLLFNSIYKLTNRAKSEFAQKSSLKRFAAQILEKRRRDKGESKNLDWCLLDGLIEISQTKPDFSEEDIIDEVCTFMLAGQDTVASALAFTLYYIAKDKKVQDKLVEEITGNFSNSNLSIEKLNELKYLEQCICESLRLCPSVPIIARKLCEDVKLGEHIIPEGCNICIPPFAIHRSPDHFSEPGKFNPDRFSRKVDKWAYIPFSAGPRVCLGKKFAMLEMKTVILRIFQNYKISLVPGKEDIQYKYRVTLRVGGGIVLKLKKRC